MFNTFQHLEINELCIILLCKPRIWVITTLSSVVVVWFIESNRVVSVDNEIASIDVVTLEYHFEYLRLMHSAFLHEIYDFILHHDSVINIVIELDLHFVLELTSLIEELLVFHWLCKVLVVLSEKIELANVGPRIETIAEGVLCPDANVLAAA